jgi:hypothetical protein
MAHAFFAPQAHISAYLIQANRATISSFNENKKRRVDCAVGINSTPSKQDIVTLLCENITTTQEQDGITWCMSDCPAHDDGKCTVK